MIREANDDTLLKLPKPIPPADSWWAGCTREEFMTRERQEQARMNVCPAEDRRKRGYGFLEG